MRTVITDSNVQVQAIGLQVLKSVVQRSTTKEDNNLLLFFSGVLIRDIFTIIQKMLKKPITKESVVMSGECLRILMLLQTVSNIAECQRVFMNLLLEAIVMVFSASEDGCSQEANDIRSVAMRLVSHLAQIPSSAVHLKNVLLSMPAMHRQQLQEVIRASVTQDHSSSQMKPVAPSLEIKLPGPASGKIEKYSPSLATSIQQAEVSRERDLPATAKENIEESENDEEDWDAFQSFTAKTDSKVESTMEGSDLVDDSSALESSNKKDHFLEFNSSQPLNIVKESDEIEVTENTREQNLVSDSAGDTGDMEVVREFQTNTDDDEDHQEIEDEKVQGTEDGAVTSRQAKEEIAFEIQLAEDVKESMEPSSAEDRERRNESPDNQIDDALSIDVQQVEGEEVSPEEHVVKEHEVKVENPDNEMGFEVKSDALPSERSSSASGI